VAWRYRRVTEEFADSARAAARFTANMNPTAKKLIVWILVSVAVVIVLVAGAACAAGFTAGLKNQGKSPAPGSSAVR
jgi:flagellar basal body-associated protein FliL